MHHLLVPHRAVSLLEKATAVGSLGFYEVPIVLEEC